MDLNNNSIITNPEKNPKNESIKENPNDIINLINSTPFENLSEYYDLESSIFLKRIEKLNLKFFWTSEYLLTNQEIKYPYNKLFLILFKQISLYVEEIARLNKQLKLKNKNEKYMKIKMAKMKEKEKENILNKQMIKNLQRNNRILEKKNEKNKNEIDKLNKRIYKSINLNGNTLTNSLFLNNKRKNNLFSSPKNLSVSVGVDSIITNGSILSKKSNNNKMSELSIFSNNNDNKSKKRKQISNSIDETFNDTRNKIINKGITQCEEEIENLDIIEDILINFKNKNNKLYNGINSYRNNLNKNNNNKTITIYSKRIKNNKIKSEINNKRYFNNNYNKNDDLSNV